MTDRKNVKVIDTSESAEKSTVSELENTKKQLKSKHCKFGVKCNIYARYRQAMKTKQEVPPMVQEHMDRFYHIPLICQGHSKDASATCTRIHFNEPHKFTDGRLLCPYDMACRNPRCRNLHGWICRYGVNCKNTNCVKCHNPLGIPNVAQKKTREQYRSPLDYPPEIESEYSATKK